MEGISNPPLSFSMLEPAIKFKTELERLWINTFDDPYYFYHRISSWMDFGMEVQTSTWGKLQYVSVSKSLNVLGYMCVDVSRSTMNADNLSLLSFKKNSLEFANDFASFICLLFGRFAVKKLNWNVVMGSPHERTYDKITKSYNGRIVGYLEKQVVMENGLYYDVKTYELTRDNFLKSIKGTRLENRSLELYNQNKSLELYNIKRSQT